jgi:DNA-binding CsgD family transcriptional regulator
MKRKSNQIDIRCPSVFRLDPTLIGEEAIVLRALAAGRTEAQVRKELRMSIGALFRKMRDMREKTGAVDNTSLIVWANLQIKSADQRIDRPERCARLA